MDGSHNPDTPSRVEDQNAQPVGSLTGPLRAGESYPALLTAYRAERDDTVNLWHEAMGHVYHLRFDAGVLCLLELSRRLRVGVYDSLPDGIGLEPLRQWIALWQREAARILGEVIAPPPPEPDLPPPPPKRPARVVVQPPRPSRGVDRLALRLARWKGEEEGVCGRATQQGGDAPTR